MQHECPRCQGAIQRTDAYCSSCGARVSPMRLVVDDDFIPVPGVVGQPDMRIPRKRRSRGQDMWRRILVVGGSLFALGVTGAGAVGALDLAGIVDVSSLFSQQADATASWARLAGMDRLPLESAHILAKHALDLTRGS